MPDVSIIVLGEDHELIRQNPNQTLYVRRMTDYSGAYTTLSFTPDLSDAHIFSSYESACQAATHFMGLSSSNERTWMAPTLESLLKK
jgi:hypothetical protein